MLVLEIKEKVKENKIEKEKSKSGKEDYVREKLCTRTPGGESND